MTKDECIIRQEKFIQYLNNMIKDITNIREKMIDYNDDVINEEILNMSEEEEIIAVCNGSDRNVEIISTLGASLLCTRTGIIVNDKYLTGKELMDFFNDEYKSKK